MPKPSKPADIDAAVKTAVVARNLNNGQSCIAAKRFIVHSAVYDEFGRRLTQQVAALRVVQTLCAISPIEC